MRLSSIARTTDSKSLRFEVHLHGERILLIIIIGCAHPDCRIRTSASHEVCNIEGSCGSQICFSERFVDGRGTNSKLDDVVAVMFCITTHP